MAKLIRIDKNGTKYYEDNVCPKCYGQGYINGYEHIEGGVCFLCGGTGNYTTHWKETDRTRPSCSRTGRLARTCCSYKHYES